MAENRTIGNCFEATAAVADNTPAMIRPPGKFLTPQGIKTKIPERRFVPTQILSKISKIRIVNEAATNGFAVLLRGVTLKSYPEKSSMNDWKNIFAV